MLDYLAPALAWAGAIVACGAYLNGRRSTERDRKPGTDSKTNQPQAAVIEIVERGRATDNTPGGSVIVPDDVRINGQSLLIPSDYPITVHEITTRADEVAHVTLTLFARRVTIAAEDDL